MEDLAKMIVISIIVGLICGWIAEPIAQSKGRKFGFLWGFLFGILGLIVVILLPDKASVQNKKNVCNVQLGGAEEIQRYKDLLDNGAITKEEFEAKKKQLLGL